MEFKTTVTELATAVREAAAKNPYNWAGCTYTMPDDTGARLAPRCIVGQALFDLAPEEEKQDVLEYLSPLKGENVGHLISFQRYEILEGDRYSTEARWLLAVQTRQDDGNSWAEAVEYADRYHPLIEEATA